MIVMLAALLLKVIIAFGIGVLWGLIVRIALLTAKALLTKIHSVLAKKVGTRVFAGAVGKLAKEVEKEAIRTNNIKSAQALLDELNGEGVVMAEINSDGTVDDKSIQILKAEEIDDHLEQLLTANQGQLILEA